MKINEKNLHKLLNLQKDIEYIECKERDNHEGTIKVKLSSGSILTGKEINKLAYQFVLNNIYQTFTFHFENLKNNNSNLKKRKVRNLLYPIGDIKIVFKENNFIIENSVNKPKILIVIIITIIK